MPNIGKVKQYFDPDKVSVKFSDPGSAIGDLFTNIVTNILLVVISIGALLSLIYGGYLYISAGGNAEQAEKGKRVIIYTVIAIIIAMASYIIYRQVTEGIPWGVII
ncbi:MAG TPA: hypothetical protein PLC05_01000 [bacterium]|nr:hypothetical protein [bacterium]HOR57328.1 hypothetical protein [bacterium]HPL56063.1 hypothetical protein [bacterium]